MKDQLMQYSDRELEQELARRAEIKRVGIASKEQIVEWFTQVKKLLNDPSEALVTSQSHLTAKLDTVMALAIKGFGS